LSVIFSLLSGIVTAGLDPSIFSRSSTGPRCAGQARAEAN
jgi:hypothetical protein